MKMISTYNYNSINCAINSFIPVWDNYFNFCAKKGS